MRRLLQNHPSSVAWVVVFGFWNVAGAAWAWWGEVAGWNTVIGLVYLWVVFTYFGFLLGRHYQHRLNRPDTECTEK